MIGIFVGWVVVAVVVGFALGWVLRHVTYSDEELEHQHLTGHMATMKEGARARQLGVLSWDNPYRDPREVNRCMGDDRLSPEGRAWLMGWVGEDERMQDRDGAPRSVVTDDLGRRLYSFPNHPVIPVHRKRHTCREDRNGIPRDVYNG